MRELSKGGNMKRVLFLIGVVLVFAADAPRIGL